MRIDGQLMRIQTWTPEFTPKEETPIVPIWIALPELPWHCYNKVLLKTILSSNGKVLYLDSPTSQKTRGSMARVKIQIDLTKPRPPHVWVGFKNSDPNKGRWQKVQYEGIPDYCMYCKHQGHINNVCTIKRRDEDFKKRREKEVEKQNKPKGDLEKRGTKAIQIQNKDKTETNTKAQDQQLVATQHTSQQQTTVTKLQTHQELEQVDQEDQWQIQKRKQHINQDQAQPKTAWRPISPPPKNTKEIMQKAPAASGMTPTISIHNNYINLEMQEQQSIGNSKEYNKNKTSDQELQATQGSDKDSPSFNHNNKEGVSEGGNLTHVLHEVDHTDPRLDYRSPATTIARHNNQNNQKQHNPKKGDDTGHLQVESGSQVDRDNGQKLQGLRDNDDKNTSDNKQNDEWHQNSLEKQHQQHSKNSPGKLSNNKSRGKMSKKKIEAIKRKQQKEVENQGKNRQKSDYDVINSEDEFDEDTQSLNESDDDEEGDETSAHLIKAFGSTFRSEFQAEIQEVADQQGLSPRDRKQVRRLIKSTSTSTSANSSRPNTRSKSKGC
ncbi:hypothetical protein H5410_013506 [Solanum commersonii]|uniref:DUF4283 domain-containing protein n=1 Tax=Solanum commersonii TaxID=4109 RepID=A0A9J5ZNK3_SOLCO|nr:hypothetical protein H5410_013506 [Solanum commersonii]